MASLATFYRKWAAQITPLFREHLAWIYAERPVSDEEAARILRGAEFVCTFAFRVRHRAPPGLSLAPVGALTGAAATALRPGLRELLKFAGPATPIALPGGLVARFTPDSGLDLELRLPAADVVSLGLYLALCHLPVSLLRACKTPGCERVFLGAKNQRYCPAHQLGARRATQLRASRAFRARKAKRNKKRRKRA